MNLQTAIKTLADAMRPDELHTNADGDLGAKLNKLLATKAGRAKLRAALAEIDDDATDEDEEIEVTANASGAPLRSPAALFAKPDPKRHEEIKGPKGGNEQPRTTQRAANSAADAPLGRTPRALLAKSTREVA